LAPSGATSKFNKKGLGGKEVNGEFLKGLSDHEKGLYLGFISLAEFAKHTDTELGKLLLKIDSNNGKQND